MEEGKIQVVVIFEETAAPLEAYGKIKGALGIVPYLPIFTQVTNAV